MLRWRTLSRSLLLLAAACCLLRSQPLPRSLCPAMGVVITGDVNGEMLQPLGSLWYYGYGFTGEDLPGQHRVFLVQPHYDERALSRVLREHPGSWWILGNEPNDPLQDDLSPSAYAAFYHRVSTWARRVDVTCRLMPAGIANADWRWAEAFRNSYRLQYGRYPTVSAWNVHNYVLDPAEDPLDVGRFAAQIESFRVWMTEAGEGDKPLVLSEFGVLSLPEGADSEDVVRYMRGAVDWLRSSGSVQAWAWFSTRTGGQFPGDLYDDEGQLTLLGRTYGELAIGSCSSMN